MNPLFPLCINNIYDVVIECQRPQSNKIFVYISPVLHWYVLSGITGLFIILIFIFDPYTVNRKNNKKTEVYANVLYDNCFAFLCIVTIWVTKIKVK